MTPPPLTESPPQTVENPSVLLGRLVRNVEQVVLGKSDVIQLAVVASWRKATFCSRTCPGSARRSWPAPWLPASIAPSDASSSRRTCCHRTSSVRAFITPRRASSSSNPARIFANVILADEINRTTPRTQSALLEAMGDGQVSVEGKTYTLDRPFLVLATQNPFEFEGTYVLPESQLDRFMIRIRMGYPIRSDERDILLEPPTGRAGRGPAARVVTADEILQLQRMVRKIRVDDSIADYLLDIVHATREERGPARRCQHARALTLYRAAQSLALVSGRDYVIPDDIKLLSVPVLAHRVVGKSFLQAGEFGAAESIIRDLVDRLRVPS